MLPLPQVTTAAVASPSPLGAVMHLTLKVSEPLYGAGCHRRKCLPSVLRFVGAWGVKVYPSQSRAPGAQGLPEFP